MRLNTINCKEIDPFLHKEILFYKYLCNFLTTSDIEKGPFKVRLNDFFKRGSALSCDKFVSYYLYKRYFNFVQAAVGPLIVVVEFFNSSLKLIIT
jgi:hypothetical protein